MLEILVCFLRLKIVCSPLGWYHCIISQIFVIVTGLFNNIWLFIFNKRVWNFDSISCLWACLNTVPDYFHGSSQCLFPWIQPMRPATKSGESATKVFALSQTDLKNLVWHIASSQSNPKKVDDHLTMCEALHADGLLDLDPSRDPSCINIISVRARGNKWFTKGP